MTDLVPTIKDRNVPDNWNPEDSINKINNLYGIVKKSMVEICHELWVAHKKYAKWGGDKTKIANEILLTWKEYCDKLPFSGTTAWRMLEKYDPDTDQLKPVIDTSELRLPERKYFVILADPPWKYDFSATDSRAIETKYPTLTPQEIIAYRDKSGTFMADLFNEDSILFLWATAPKLREALQIMDGWNIEYKTHAIWDKGKIGMGYWFRGQHELLLIGTKGTVSAPAVEARVSSIICEERVTQHSRKPEKVYEIIERMFPVNYENNIHIELFARNKREGWGSYGYEIQ